MMYGLPVSVTLRDTEYNIRSDFRDVLDIIEILNDVNLSDQEKGYLTLLYFYEDFEHIPNTCYQEAIKKCFWFINGGADKEEGKEKLPTLVDWEQDFPYIVAPINKALGAEIRSAPYLHWWTFLAAYMEIGDCLFSNIVSIREKKARGKPLDKSEKEWYEKNREIVDIKNRYSDLDNEFLSGWI